MGLQNFYTVTIEIIEIIEKKIYGDELVSVVVWKGSESMIDLILDLIFIGAIVIALVPVLLGLYGVFLVLKIFFISFTKGIWYVCMLKLRSTESARIGLLQP